MWPKVIASSHVARPTKNPARTSRLRRLTWSVTKTATKPHINPSHQVNERRPVLARDPQ